MGEKRPQAGPSLKKELMQKENGTSGNNSITSALAEPAHWSRGRYCQIQGDQEHAKNRPGSTSTHEKSKITSHIFLSTYRVVQKHSTVGDNPKKHAAFGVCTPPYHILDLIYETCHNFRTLLSYCWSPLLSSKCLFHENKTEIPFFAAWPDK